MKWISCDGGPHILMDQLCMENWEAGDNPSSGRIVDAKFRWNSENLVATDYDLACDIQAYIGLIHLDNGSAIVINDDVPSSCLLEDKHGIVHIVVLYTCESENYESEIIDAVNSLPESNFIDTGIQYSNKSDDVYLFPACDRFPNWVYDYDKIRLKSGVYTVGAINSLQLKNSEIRIYRLKLRN